MKSGQIIRNLLLLALSCNSFFTASGQELIHKKQTLTQQGDHLLYGGIGFINPAAFTFNIFATTAGGNPTSSANINYQYAVRDRLLVGAFVSYYRVNADFSTSLDVVAEEFMDLTFDELLMDLDCILLGDCSTTISERVSVFTLGGKFSYTKRIARGVESYMSAYLGYSFHSSQTLTASALDFLSSELSFKVEVPRLIYFSSIGMRYYLTRRLAIQGEVGFGNSHLINVGMSLKL